jgi:hypothetical protein
MKFILASLLIIISISSFAQAKKDTVQVQKPVYKKVIKLDVQDFNTLTEALSQWKRLSMYDPQTEPEQKVRIYKDIEAYLITLMKKVQVDSVQILNVTGFPPVKKK